MKVFIGWTKSKEAIASHKYPESGLHPREVVDWALSTDFNQSEVIVTNSKLFLFALALRFTESLEVFYVFDDGNLHEILIDDEGKFIEHPPENWGDEIYQLSSGVYGHGDFSQYFKDGVLSTRPASAES
jgi:hypothetical protein